MSRTVGIVSQYSSSITNKLRQLLPSMHFIEVQSTDLSALKNADYIVADYNLIGPHLYDLPKLKWLQGTWAGLDALWPHIKNRSPPPFPITRTSGDNFGRLMGEYVIGNIVFWERNYFKARENQMGKIWDASVCSHEHRSISDLTVGILGIGSIGNIIGKTLNYLGATVYGYGRRNTVSLESAEYSHISKYYTKSNLPRLLASVDYLVNVLPLTDETTNLLGNGLLQNCRDKRTVFVNIGRGNIIKETELVWAIKEKWISGAILDVFEQEPLPKESKLWNMSNVFITPHIAGNSRAQDIAEKFKLNLDRFENERPLINQVDFEKGY